MKKFRIRGSLADAVAILLFTACGRDGGEAASEDDVGQDGQLTEVSIGVVPVVYVAQIYLGVQDGIFEDHGLDVDLTVAQGGAAIIPAVQSGDFDFGFSNITSLVIGESQGLPLQV